MNRLSFLKTLGVGIAAAVITPKILIETPEKPKAIDLAKPPYYNDLKTRYGHYEEPWLHSNRVESLVIHDICIDKDARLWLCTAKGIDSVELTALEANPEPNFIEVNNSAFPEYFIIFGNAFQS